MMLAGAARLLPHDLRRGAYALSGSRRYKNLRGRRAPADDGRYSFRPYLETGTLFVHIPKAAGVSVARALYGTLAGGHVPMADYELAFSRAEFDGLYKYCFVRDPWARLLSTWRFLSQGGMGPSDRAWSARHLRDIPDFETFVKGWLARQPKLHYHHLRPQVSFLRSYRGRGSPIDFVGYFENIEADFDHLRRRIRPAARLEHRNRTGGGATTGYAAAYDDEMRAIAARLYHEDIETFGYRFAEDCRAAQLAARAQGALQARLHRI